MQNVTTFENEAAYGTAEAEEAAISEDHAEAVVSQSYHDGSTITNAYPCNLLVPVGWRCATAWLRDARLQCAGCSAFEPMDSSCLGTLRFGQYKSGLVIQIWLFVVLRNAGPS